MGTLFVIVGILAVAAGIFARTFYAADILSVSPYKDRDRMTTWLGRIVFIVVGVALAALGIKFLVAP